MSIFLDSSKPAEIEKFKRMGIIRGVTTNPTIMAKDGVSGGIDGIKERIADIVRAAPVMPISVEVLSNDRDEMIKQAREFSEISPYVNIKIPIHGPGGEENLSVIRELDLNNIDVNATAMMNAQQCLLAAEAGAKYVSIFGGRVANMGYDPKITIREILRLLELNELDAQIIVGSVREVLNVTEWMLAGAHIITVTPELLNGMIVHPYTKETVAMFLGDAEKMLHEK